MLKLKSLINFTTPKIEAKINYKKNNIEASVINEESKINASLNIEQKIFKAVVNFSKHKILAQLIPSVSGRSAYRIAVEKGFKGTEEEWLLSLKGNPFIFEDFTPEQLMSLKGEQGYTPVKNIDYFDGISIVSILKTGSAGLTDMYTITYSDNTTSTFNLNNGIDGVDGKDGYTPYIQDGFWYINGVNTGVKAEGTDGIGDMQSIEYDPTNKKANMYDYKNLDNKPVYDGFSVPYNSSTEKDEASSSIRASSDIYPTGARSLVTRDLFGRAKISKPLDPYDIANKVYVDDLINSLVEWEEI